MMTKICNDELIHILNHLIEVCQQSQVSYLDAVKTLPTLVHRAACAQYALQRENFATHLSHQILCISGKPVMHFGADSKQRCQPSFGIRSFVKSSSAAAVLYECRISEETAKSLYEEILKMQDQLPASLYTVIYNQYEKIIVSYTEVMRWCQSASAS